MTHLLPGISEMILAVMKQQINVTTAIQGMAATLEYVYPQPQPENVHEVYAVAQFGKVGDQTGRIRTVYAGEHQKSPHGKHYTVDGAEGPTYFYDGSRKYLPGDGLYIERVDGQYGPCYHKSGSDSQSFVAQTTGSGRAYR